MFQYNSKSITFVSFYENSRLKNPFFSEHFSIKKDPPYALNFSFEYSYN